jgi:putative DNA methylase
VTGWIIPAHDVRLINQALDEALREQEGEFDPATRWALAWFAQHGFAEGEFGAAETLSKAGNVSIEGLAADGILEAKRGRVRLLKPSELTADRDPARGSASRSGKRSIT